MKLSELQIEVSISMESQSNQGIRPRVRRNDAGVTPQQGPHERDRRYGMDACGQAHVQLQYTLGNFCQCLQLLPLYQCIVLHVRCSYNDHLHTSNQPTLAIPRPYSGQLGPRRLRAPSQRLKPTRLVLARTTPALIMWTHE